VDKQHVPRELGLAAIRSALVQSIANFDKNKELSDLLDQIRERCTGEVYALLGSQAKDYTTFRDKARDIAKTMRPLFTSTPEGRRIKSRFQETRLAEANEFIKSLGVNPKDVKSILKKYQEESRSIIEKNRITERELNFSHFAPNGSVITTGQKGL
jgi:hypothetical protein